MPIKLSSATKTLFLFTLLPFLTIPNGLCDEGKDTSQDKPHHADKPAEETELTFGIPVAKPKHKKHHKETIEDRCWDDDNCRFPTLFCLFFDPDNKKGKCKLPTS